MWPSVWVCTSAWASRSPGMEMEIVLQQLLERVQRIEPAGAPVPIIHNVLRGFESLPVSITAA